MLINTVIFFIIFCYTKIFNIGLSSDIQPYYFIMIVISFLIVKKKKVKNYEKILMVIFILTNMYILYFTKVVIFAQIRGIYGYISMFLVSYMFYNFCFWINMKSLEKKIKFYYWIWVLAGIVQMKKNDAFIFWISRNIGNTGRGSVSFAPEPAYFSLFLILVSLIIYTIDEKNKIYFIISLFIALICAKSTVGIGYLLLINMVIYFNKKQLPRYIICGVLFFLGISTYIYIYYDRIDLRLIRVMRGLLNSPIEFIKSDGSIMVRVTHVYYSIKGAIENYFLPFGYSTWSRYLSYVLGASEISEKNNINTLFGRMLFELGGVFTLYFYLTLKRIIKNIKLFIIILILGIDGLNITNPLFGVLLGINYYLYISNKEKKNEK